MSESSQKKHKKLKDVDLRHAELPPLPAYVSNESKEEKTEYKGGKPLSEAQKILKDVEKASETIRRQLDEMYEEMGLTPSSLKTYLEDPSNFDAKDWEFIQKNREELLSEFNIPEKLRATPVEKKSTLPISKKKRKSPGHRRGWLPLK